MGLSIALHYCSRRWRTVLNLPPLFQLTVDDKKKKKKSTVVVVMVPSE